MKTLITLCVLLLTAATVHAQTFDLLEQTTANAAPSPFDLMEVPSTQYPVPSEREAARLGTGDSELGTSFDLLYVAAHKPKDAEPDVVESTGCSCGCKKPDCHCSVVAAGAAGCRKPVIRMRSASWCTVCPRVEKDVANAKDCPFELQVIKDEDSATSLPRFTWEAGGKWYVPIDPQTGEERSGYSGLDDLIAHWKATQPKVAVTAPRDEPSKFDTRTLPKTVQPNSQRLITQERDGYQDQIAASVQRHFVARVQGPPVSLSKPGDSEKKRAEHSPSGSTTSGSGSEKKSPAPSGPSMAKPLVSTPSPGGRS